MFQTFSLLLCVFFLGHVHIKPSVNFSKMQRLPLSFCYLFIFKVLFIIQPTTTAVASPPFPLCFYSLSSVCSIGISAMFFISFLSLLSILVLQKSLDCSTTTPSERNIKICIYEYLQCLQRLPTLTHTSGSQKGLVRKLFLEHIIYLHICFKIKNVRLNLKLHS